MSQEHWERRMERPTDIITALAMAQDVNQRLILFAASVAGIHRSSDGGQTWTLIDTESNGWIITSLASSADFARDRTLFIGTELGCYRSTDAGHTWQPALSGGMVLAVATMASFEPVQEPLRPSPITVFVGTEKDGVYRSTDGGESWRAVNAGLLDLTILALAFSPHFASDGTGFAATASGLYRTRNGGKGWRGIDLPLEETAVQCLALSPSFHLDGLILVGTEDDGLLYSDDAGTTWHLSERLAGCSVTAVGFSSDGRLIAVASDQGIWITRDRGVTWTRHREDLGPVLCLAIVPRMTDDVLVVGLEGNSVIRAENGGANGPTNDG